MRLYGSNLSKIPEILKKYKNPVVILKQVFITKKKKQILTQINKKTKFI